MSRRRISDRAAAVQLRGPAPAKRESGGMHWDVLDQGFVSRRGGDLAVGPRVVVLPGGEAVCSFMLTAKTATNDFAPALCRSADHGATWSEPRLVWPHLRSRWSLF